MIKHINISVSGKVQNVGFRFAAIDKALELGLFGTVKNLDSEKVYLEAEGEVENLKEFLRFCKIGPQGAKVQNMEYVEGEMKNYKEFAYEDNFYADKK